ncbi:MAG: PEGA domain-containing protein [Deltaproteobacteria bacterium]|nr:PEGA domain-containing protein [Deltaproteobacteria bacterium]
MQRAAALAAVVLVAVPAAAQPAAPAAASQPSAADRETARSLMNQGASRYAQRDYWGALEAFKAADVMVRTPTTGLEVGRAQAVLGRLLDARDTLVRVHNLPVAPNEPAVFVAARKDAAELAAQLAERIPSLSVQVVGVPDGIQTQVKIDEALLAPAVAKLPRKLDPGKHTVTVNPPGFAEAKQVVALKEREQQRVTIELRPERLAPRPTPIPVARPAPAPAQPPAVSFGPKQPEKLEPESTGISALSPLVWVGFGVGAACLLTGTVTGILTLSNAADIGDQCPGGVCTEAQREDYDGVKTLANLSSAGFVVGAVGIAAGAVGLTLTLWGSGPDTATAPAQAAVVLQPLLGTGSAGLAGRF